MTGRVGVERVAQAPCQEGIPARWRAVMGANETSKGKAKRIGVTAGAKGLAGV